MELRTYVQLACRAGLTNVNALDTCVSKAASPEKFKNAAFFSMTRVTVHINPSRKRSFQKVLFKPEKFENELKPTFRFRVDGKLCENGAFENVFIASPVSNFACVLQTGPT